MKTIFGFTPKPADPLRTEISKLKEHIRSLRTSFRIMNVTELEPEVDILFKKVLQLQTEIINLN
jgi:hypothetical protein